MGYCELFSSLVQLPLNGPPLQITYTSYYESNQDNQPIGERRFAYPFPEGSVPFFWIGVCVFGFGFFVLVFPASFAFHCRHPLFGFMWIFIGIVIIITGVLVMNKFYPISYL